MNRISPLDRRRGRRRGRRVAPAPVFNPATGEQAATVDLAIGRRGRRRRRRRQGRVPGVAGDERCRAAAEVMFHLRELVDANRKEIASLLTAEHGKVLSDALGEVARGLENIEFACGIPHLLKGGYSEQAATGVDVYSIRQPLGVVAGITPFNFPAMVPMWMFANALACGNTFVLKPSEKDPSASLFMAELLAKAGLPPRLLQRRAGRQGRRRPAPRAPRHRGGQLRRLDADRPATSTRPGTANGKRVQALGGAKNHMLVLPDADLDMAADAAVSAGYGSAGERCMAISVVLAVDVDRRRAGRQDRRAHPGDQGRARHRARQRDGPADHRRAPRQGRAATSTAPPARAPPSSSTGATALPAERLLPQAVAARQRHARTCRRTTTRSSGRCCRSCA